MSQEMLSDAVIGLILLTGYFGTLCISGFVADYILPYILLVQRWLDIMPPYEDDYENKEDCI